MNGSELLLNSAERFGLVLARAQEASRQPRRLSRSNIGKLNAKSLLYTNGLISGGDKTRRYMHRDLTMPAFEWHHACTLALVLYNCCKEFYL